MDLLSLHKDIAYGKINKLVDLSALGNDIRYHCLNSIILRNSGKNAEGLEYLQENIVEENLTSDNDKIAYFVTLFTLSLNLEKANTIRRCIEVCDSLICEDKSLYTNLWISDYYTSLGMYYHISGDMDKAHKTYLKALKLELEPELSIIYRAKVKNNLAILYRFLGKLNDSLTILNENLQIWENMENNFAIAQTLGNMGEIFREKGNFDLAIINFRQIEKIFIEFGNTREIMLTRSNIGKLLYLKGNVKSAREIFQETRSLVSSDMNGFDISTYFLEYIEGELIAGNTEMASKILDDYHDNFGDSTNYYLQLRYKGAKAMVLASSDRYRDKFQAQNIFEDLLREGIDDFNLRIISHVYLIELLITEYKANEEEEIPKEIKKHIKGIEEVANSQNSHRLIAKAMVLEAQLKIFQGDPSNTKYLLNKAYEITEEYNIFNLAIQISLLYDNLFVKINKEPTDSKINFLPNKFFKSDDVSPMVSEREICLFYVNRTSDLQILREFSLDNVYHGSNTKMILKNLEKEYYRSEDPSVYRFSFNDYKVIILQDELPKLGYIFIGDTYFAIKKLEAFNEVLRFYLQTKYEDKTDYNDQEIIEAVNDILVGKDSDASFMEATGEDSTHINQLSDYKVLLHPIRISIMKIMERSYRMSRVDLEKMIGGKRGTFASHLQKLQDLELIDVENVFIDGKPRKYITLTITGIAYYNEFKREIKRSIN